MSAEAPTHAPFVPYQVPAGVRASATLVLLRDARHEGDAALEVLMLERAESTAEDMRSGATVFPGGVLDPRDRQAQPLCVSGDEAAWRDRLGLAEGAVDYAVAALRETFEECGLLLACTDEGLPLDTAPIAHSLQPWRERLQRGEAGIAEMCRSMGVWLDLRGLAYAAHWLTPPGLPKRWDARFFVAAAPPRQTPEPDGGETRRCFWITPQAALDPAGGLKLLPAMRRTLAELARFDDAAAALAAFGTRRGVALTMPRRGRTRAGAVRIVLPDELPYAEIARLDPEGRGDVCTDLVAGVPVRLGPRVWRVTAPNPGAMTGPGTNSYLVGDPAEGLTVIDPGPDDAVHVRALLDAAAAAGGRIVRVLATHTHRDHSPAAAALAAATGAEVLGRTAAHPEWQDSNFRPARELTHGERLALASDVTLRVIHTPGHASNHLCFLFEQEQLLFTGDHVMQGSTVVINPPDGDMAAYLRSLQALLEEDLAWLAPGHGFLVAQPHAVLSGLIAHRLRREAKVLAAVRSLAEGAQGIQETQKAPATLAQLLPQVYDDVPPALHRVAERSLLAHLLKLAQDGAVRAVGENWWPAG
jgi:glyoxylase-like metal-dependent hydrolase (beta-lactamase superfamily II)/8-oxo-dGTP pyrophosphatase MutT (NUDIX family)